MIIKKFQGSTEEEAILAARDEMGNNAVVMNIRTTKKKGIFRWFKKDIVEVTAALEEKEDAPTIKTPVKNIQHTEILPSDGEKEVFEDRLNNIQSLLEQQIKKEVVPEKAPEPIEEEEKESNGCLKLVYQQLINNEVEEVYANQIISEVEKLLKKEAPLDTVLSAVYQKIILKLGEPDDFDVQEGKKKIYFFIGPTGVGKTTTIAKLASDMKLTRKAKIALLTSDTYRIAAVEQLRTYANILDIPLDVIYSEEDLKEGLERLKEYDVIFVDTAGRSHKNLEQCDELFRLIESIDETYGFEKEICLVLSLTAKYKDLEKICNTYSRLGTYRIIFTKLDETSALGNILNIAILTNGKISYTTYGQNVPDDINLIDVQSIAKQLLGGVN
ncbi:MAG: flagellar biosynthesis protein FlhF [Lachnospiraceae bacterium]|nr:flagellar biosynthesis protein FlhF [Lachnospiraceae bacterium]